MNTDNNRRFQETEEKIIKAYSRLAYYDKPIRQITVSDVCKEAGIHRTTFYGHFQDIPDLNARIDSIQFAKLLDCFNTEDGFNMREGLIAQMTFFYKNRALIRRNLKDANNYELMTGFFQEQYTAQYSEAYMKTFGCRDEKEMEYHRLFFTTGLVALIQKWIMDDCPETPEEIADLVCRIYRF